MGLFNRKDEEKEEKKEEKKSSKVNDAKKTSTKDLYQEEKITKRTGGKIKKYIDAYKLLIKPLITEKASILASKNKYVFEVACGANKIETAKAIEAVYNVKPIKINIIKKTGKIVRSGRTYGKRKDWKKAIVTLPKGENIKIYEGV